MFGKHEKPSPDDVPQTISAEEWDRITRAAAKQTPSPLDPNGSSRQDTWTASARNASLN